VANPDVRRLFFALWPDETVRSTLVDLQKRLPPGMGRLVSGDNLHITLVFLGATPIERQHCIEEGLAGVDRPGFSLRLDQMGYWRKPQVLWVGSAATPLPLTALVQDLRDIAGRCGCEVETRPFQIHLTLCRKVHKPPRELPAIAAIPWPANSFALVESITAADGVRYKVLRTWGLPSGAAGSASG